MSIKNGYHFDDSNRRYYRNEEGSRIPEEICLCFAHEPSECNCDCTSWNIYSENEGYGYVYTEETKEDYE